MSTSLLAATWLSSAASGFREAFYMFWETLWALVLGFALSGSVQRFVPKEAMRRRLGNHGPRAVVRASGYGMVSSSCSYAASAMAKSLVARGADFVAAMVFMFASTNLVVELGIILLVLLGWQFLAAQFLGGAIMVVLLALVGGVVLRGRLVDQARARLAAGSPEHAHHGEVDDQVSEDAERPVEHPGDAETASLAAWSDAASYAVADATMLRKELLIGYTVAGFLAALVPATTWDRLFLHGHGIWTSIENALVAPLIAVISWVCSIGNVPLAAALWKGGISFGGVIAFIFADLIAMPLILIYRKYYGAKLTIRLVAVFYGVMATAGLAVGGIFSVLGIVPTTRPAQISPSHFEWNYTTYLNFVFLLVAAVIYALHRSRRRLGGGEGLAFDPVCGMQVRMLDAPASYAHDGETTFFCSDRCKERFVANHGEGASPRPAAVAVSLGRPAPSAFATAIDPVCGMSVEVRADAVSLDTDGSSVYFCCEGCRNRFVEAAGAPGGS